MAKVKQTIVFVSIISSLLVGCSASSVENTSQPYAGLETRNIKALSEDKIKGLLEGKGLQYALAAELNHYPGPLHALELSQELQLSEQQKRELERLKESVNKEAKQIGQQLVELEEQMDLAFASGTITEDQLATLTNQIAITDGQLRNAHLKTHLKVKEILTPEQVTHYDQLRGYQDGENQQHNEQHNKH